MLAGYVREMDIFMTDTVRMRLTGSYALAMATWVLPPCVLQRWMHRKCSLERDHRPWSGCWLNWGFTKS